MSALLFIGVDPGPTPGVVALITALDRIEDARVVQCSASALFDVLRGLDPNRVAMLQVEMFVARGRMNAAQRQTAKQVGTLQQLYAHTNHVVTRTASQVKAWATDERLEAAGLAEHLKGMRHARDGARHALFNAAHSGAIPDPLSRRSR